MIAPLEDKRPLAGSIVSGERGLVRWGKGMLAPRVPASASSTRWSTVGTSRWKRDAVRSLVEHESEACAVERPA